MVLVVLASRGGLCREYAILDLNAGRKSNESSTSREKEEVIWLRIWNQSENS